MDSLVFHLLTGFKIQQRRQQHMSWTMLLSMRHWKKKGALKEWRHSEKIHSSLHGLGIGRCAGQYEITDYMRMGIYQKLGSR